MKPPFLRSSFALLPILALALAGGCASDGGTTSERPSGSTASTMDEDWTPARSAESEALGAHVERQYVVGPEAASRFGYRVDWQHQGPALPYKMVVVEGDSVFALDDRNYLTHLRRDSGIRAWRQMVAEPIETVFGVTSVPAADSVFVTLGSEIVVLDATTGALVAKQRLTKIANTSPVAFGPYLIYGSRGGELVWHSYALDAYRQGYDIAQSINVPPVVDDGYVVTVGIDGTIMSLTADTASQVWNRRALDPVVARPALRGGIAYVASLDQHLRAYDVTSARSPLWQYLTDSPLDDGPVIVGDYVFQQVDSEGLVCLEAIPADEPGGVVVWRSPNAGGNVVARMRRNLIVWNDATRRIELVDVGSGALVESMYMPHMTQFLAVDTDEGELYATADDGRLVRLVPRR